MNKNIVGVIIAAVAVIGIVGVVVANKKDTSSTSSVSSSDTGQMGKKDGKAAQTSSGGGDQDLTAKTEVSMDIKGFAFANKTIKIKKGTKVTWTNQDDARHNVVAKEDGGPMGPLLGKGENYSFTFDTVGTFNYNCEPHPYMKGVVNVVE